MPYFRCPIAPGLFLVLALLGCGPGGGSRAGGEARRVIDRAILAHYGRVPDTLDVTFRFRNRNYRIHRRGGEYAYGRDYPDTLADGRVQTVRDELTNDGLARTVDGVAVELTAKERGAAARAVNSVRYFFLLPYGLNDPAVNARLLDTTTIDGRTYDRVRVTFDRAGGGRDYEDVYHHYFNRETGELDYLAYNFAVNGGGVRFREATNKRRLGGVLFQDYVNYGLDGDTALARVERRFANGELRQLSRIENVSIVLY